jgi:GR25 family glycosyltransferase involved in LPS biosynthesis
MNQISVYIITVKDARNYDNLIESVIQSFGVNPTILLGVTPKDLPCGGMGPHMHEGKYRQLSCHEVAAALSHARARELALTEGSTWSFFLEDDSELIQKDNLDFFTDVMTLPSEIPFFIHLFPEQNGILKNCKFPGMKFIWKMPDYANAYALNSKGLVTFTKSVKVSHLYLADWPKFSRHIVKIAPIRSIFRHPIQSIDTSLISHERLRIQGSLRAFTFIYRLKQFIFKISRIPLPKYGTERIATENLRSVTWQ